MDDDAVNDNVFLKRGDIFFYNGKYYEIDDVQGNGIVPYEVNAHEVTIQQVLANRRVFPIYENIRS